MKNSLGKMIELLLVLCSISLLHGQGFSTDATLNKENVYIKEPVVLTFNIKQTDYSKVMFFDFTLTQSDAYEFYRLDAKEEDSYQNAQIHYTYLLYPLQSGQIDIRFKLIQKVTTKENVAYSFSGDRDNVKGITTVNTPINIKPLKLQVKSLPEKTLLVGDFTLKHKIKTQEANAYEPIAYSLEIKGKGYPPILGNTLVSTDDYTLFKERPQVNTVRTTQGTINTFIYPMALSAKKSFIFKAIDIKAFNPDTQQSYTLSIPEQKFDITAVAESELVDKVNSPAPIKAADFSWIDTLLGYIMVFMVGYLTAKSVQWHKKEKVKADPFAIMIEQTNDPKRLLTLLIAQDSKKYESPIEKLEAHIYRKKPLNLKALKKELNA